MNKSELNKTEANRTLDGLIKTMEGALETGEPVCLFGWQNKQAATLFFCGHSSIKAGHKRQAVK